MFPASLPLAPLRAVAPRSRATPRAARAAAGSSGGRPPVRGKQQPRRRQTGKPNFIEDDNQETGRPKSEAERVLPKYVAEVAKLRGEALDAAAPPAPPSLLDDAGFEARLAALKAAAPPPQPSAAAVAAEAGPLGPKPTATAPPPPPAAAAEDPRDGPSGWSNAVKVIAVLCVVAYGVVFGLEDLVSGGGTPAPGAPLSAAAKQKLQKVVDDFAAASSKAGDSEAGTASSPKNALAAGQAAARLEEWEAAASAFAVALADPSAGAADAGVALPGRVDALVRGGRATEALAAVAAFEASAAGSGPGLAASGLDGIDLRLLRAKALAARGDAEAAEALFDALAAEAPEDFRPLLAKGLFLREQGRALAADKALVNARLLAPKDARSMVDGLIGDR